MTKGGLFRGKTAASMLLAALLLAAVWFLSDTDPGGMNTDSAHISIITRFYGVTAEEIEKSITIPMEEAVSGLAGIEELKSGSEFSLSRLDLRLASSTDIDQFLIEARERIDRSYAWISQRNPAVQKPQVFNSVSDQQAIFIVAFSNSLSTEELRPLVENEIKPSYSRIEGLGEIEISGGALPEIHVNVDTDRAAAFGYSSDSIASLIRNSNIYRTAGVIDNGKNRFPLSVEARIKSLNELRALPVGQVVKLNDIAEVGFSFREPENISRLNSRERVSLHIKSSSNNLISISRHLRNETAKWENRGYEAEIVYDKGAELEDSFKRIAAALGIGMLVSSAMLLLFRVRNYRVITLFFTQPIILLLSLGLLAAAGLSPDRWLLAGLTVGIGMILDSALLTTDALERTEGTIKGIIKPLISSTLSTLAALLPVISLTGEIPGLRQLIAALAVMLSVSLVVSLIFIPPFYRTAKAGPSGCFIFSLAKLRRRLLSFSGRIASVSGSFRKRRIFILASTILPLAGIICLAALPIQLDSPADSPVIFARVELEEGESMESSDSKIRNLCKKIEAEDPVVSVQSTSRRGGGSLTVRFNDKKTSRNDMVANLKALGNTIPGGFIYIPDGDRSDRLKLTISVTGAETDKLKEISREALKSILENNWALEGVLHFKDAPPAFHFIPDSEALAAAGLSASTTASFLRWNLQGPVADKWHFSGKERDLRVMAADYEKLTASQLGSLKISGTDPDSFSRLDQLGSFIETTDTSRINRLNRQHSESFTVTCRKTDPVKLNAMIWEELDKVKLPSGYSFIPSSKLIERQELFRRMWLRFILAIILIFFLLSIERESLKQAALILLQLPFILSIPLIIIRMAGLELGTETILGLILVSGMGINNGILIMDNLENGVFQAVKQRFNGLFLTTVTSIGGLVPMLFTADPFFRNLTIILITGLSASFFVSICLFPVFLNRKAILL